MRNCSLVVISLLSACIPHRRTEPLPQEPFAYARELGEVLEAIDDLQRSESGYFDAKAAAAQLSTAFEKACENYEVSCDRSAWQHPWKNRGEVGLNLAHALSAIDRAYGVWSRDRDSRLQASVQALDDARRTVRNLIFTREHVGVAHLPEHRELMIASEELTYARALIGDAPPPAEVPWDANTTRAVIDESRAALVEQAPDDLATVHYNPDPADFGNIKYIGRMLIARDLVDRAIADIHDGDRGHHGRSPLDPIVYSLNEAKNALAGTVSFAASARRQPAKASPGKVYTDEIQELAIARKAVSQWNINDPELVRRHAIAEQAIKDSFVAACAAENITADEHHWLPAVVERDLPDVALTAVDAALSQASNDRFAKARRALAPAFAAIYQLEAMEEHWAEGGQAFYGLHVQLVLARNMLDVAPPADHPWDSRSAVADMNAAIDAIDAAKVTGLRKSSDVRERFHRQAPNLDYGLRLVMAHEGIARALAEAERSPGTGPRAALVNAHAVVDALAVALGKKTVTAQRSAAPKR